MISINEKKEMGKSAAKWMEMENKEVTCRRFIRKTGWFTKRRAVNLCRNPAVLKGMPSEYPDTEAAALILDKGLSGKNEEDGK